MKLIYHLTTEARQRLFVAEGRDPGMAQGLEVDPATLTADDRRLLLVINAAITNQVDLMLPEWDVLGPRTAPLKLDAIVTDPAELIAVYRDARQAAEATFAAAREAAIEKAELAYDQHPVGWSAPREPRRSEFGGSPRWAELVVAYERARDRYAEAERQAAAHREAERQAAEAEKARRLAERAAWAQANGSPRLRKCVEQGYDCQRLYALERAAAEHPGYVVDFDDKAAWKDRAGPSEAALDEAARVGGTVVWLTRQPHEEFEVYGEGWEAVVIRAYLGKYDLIRVM